MRKDRSRRSSRQRGYCGRWDKASRLHRTLNPACAICLMAGRAAPATQVDHIRPHKDDPELFWDEDNWQSLCRACHGKKTWLEEMGATFAWPMEDHRICFLLKAYDPIPDLSRRHSVVEARVDAVFERRLTDAIKRASSERRHLALW